MIFVKFGFLDFFKYIYIYREYSQINTKFFFLQIKECADEVKKNLIFSNENHPYFVNFELTNIFLYLSNRIWND